MIGVFLRRVIFYVHAFRQKKQGVFGQVIGSAAALQRPFSVGDVLQDIPSVGIFPRMAGFGLNTRVVNPHVNRFEKTVIDGDAVETAALSGEVNPKVWTKI